MPIFLAMSERFNNLFRSDNIGKVPVEPLGPGTKLSELASALGIATSPQERGYLDAWPTGLQEALRATLLSAATRKMGVVLEWAPGYDYEVHLWEARPTANTKGHISIQLRSRYPDE